MDREGIRGRVLEAYQQGPDAVVELVLSLVTEFATRVDGLSARLAASDAKIAALRAKLGANSRNSGKPPSTDGPGVRPHPKSQRGRSGLKSGGQTGHAGHTLRMSDHPDEVQRHTPRHCRGCGESLEEAPTIGQERRQVVDIPPVKARVIEHQAETRRCSSCGVETVGEFPEGVVAAIQYGPSVGTVAVYLNQEQLLPSDRTCKVLSDLFDCPMSEGTLERVVAECHERLFEVETAIRQGVEKAAIAHFDETGVNVGGKTHWLHVASTLMLTYYAVHRKRGREAIDEIGILAKYRGRAIHDGLASYWQYDECEHGLCNAHHLRELTFVEEELGQVWAKGLKDLLIEIKRSADDARERGLVELSVEARREFEARYDAILMAGLEVNPPQERTGKRGRPKRGKARCLVDRLRERKAATLAFMNDLAVPFDNNQAERDIRMVKVREKISGCFRTPIGAERFSRIRGYISTLRKQGLPIYSALRGALVGTPPMPATS